MVDDIDDLLRAAEIAVQVDTGVFGQLRCLIRGALLHCAVEVFGIRIAETVNALLAVADDKQIRAVMRCAAAA